MSREGKPGAPKPGWGAQPCMENEERLVDLVVGHLSGQEREACLAHLERCPRCSARVGALSESADELLVLAPEAEPPAGFEMKVFAHLHGQGSLAAHRQRRGLFVHREGSRRRVLGSRGLRALGVAAGLVLLAGIALGGGFVLGRSSRQQVTASAVMTGQLMEAGQEVGKVMVYPGHSTWLFMYLERGRWSGSLECQVVGADGHVMTVGAFWASGRAPAWGAQVAMPASQVREAIVLGPAGRVMAVAHLA